LQANANHELEDAVIVSEELLELLPVVVEAFLGGVEEDAAIQLFADGMQRNCPPHLRIR
jgi:hypothetical protein